MNNLLVFFALPIATIILSAILETFIKCPIKVSGIFFSIYLVVAFALGGTAEFIVAAILYTIVSFVTAFIICLICRNRQNIQNDNSLEILNNLNTDTINNLIDAANYINNNCNTGNNTNNSNCNNSNRFCRYR